jgi:hypothetical protein
MSKKHSTQAKPHVPPSDLPAFANDNTQRPIRHVSAVPEFVAIVRELAKREDHAAEIAARLALQPAIAD